MKENLLIYNKLTEFFADFRHFCRAVILLIFSYLHYKNSINAARWRHDGGGGLEIIVNKKLRNDGGTRRRPRCKYASRPHSNFICSFAAVQPLGNGNTTAAVHCPAGRCFAAIIHVEKGLFCEQNSPFWRLSSRQWHIVP